MNALVITSGKATLRFFQYLMVANASATLSMPSGVKTSKLISDLPLIRTAGGTAVRIRDTSSCRILSGNLELKEQKHLVVYPVFLP